MLLVTNVSELSEDARNAIADPNNNIFVSVITGWEIAVKRAGGCINAPDNLIVLVEEKDRLTIEQTFEALLKLVQELDQEERRAVREGLDEESLAIFDLLKKPDLSASDVERIKHVAVELLEALKAERLRVDQWRDKEATRDAVQVTIRDFLWRDDTTPPRND